MFHLLQQCKAQSVTQYVVVKKSFILKAEGTSTGTVRAELPFKFNIDNSEKQKSSLAPSERRSIHHQAVQHQVPHLIY